MFYGDVAISTTLTWLESRLAPKFIEFKFEYSVRCSHETAT